MPPPYQAGIQQEQAVQNLLSGMNSMQMRAGYMPGGQLPSMSGTMQSPAGFLPPPAQVISIGQQMQAQQAPIQQLQHQQLQVRFQEQQSLARVTGPAMPVGGGISPYRRPTDFEQMYTQVNFPEPQFGGAGLMARQRTQGATNEYYGALSSGVGLAARGIGDAGAFAFGGAVGVTATEHYGGGQALQDFGTSLVQPIVQRREQGLRLQADSGRYYTGGQDLSASGIGLSTAAAMNVSSRIGEMASSHAFQEETGNRFNRQDLLKISRSAGNLGMLDQAGSADEIAKTIEKVSKALSVFMKVAEQPDAMKAMEEMAQMRSMGMNMGQISQSVRNAQQFARMAGTTVEGVMAAGMPAAQRFAQAGMTAGTGLRAGMAAEGMSTQVVAGMSDQMRALSGGQAGVAQTIAAGAQRALSTDMLLPSMLTRRNGQLSIDREQVQRLMSGQLSVDQMARQGAQRIQQLGGRQAIEELSVRRGELQDQMGQQLGGEGMALMPLLLARGVQDRTGMSRMAALRTIGMNEQQARTFNQMAGDPQFWERMRQHERVQRREQQEARKEQRDEVKERAEEVIPVERIARFSRQNFVNPVRSLVERGERFVAEREDRDEEQAVSGGGAVVSHVDASRLDSDIQRAAGRDSIRTRAGMRRGIAATNRALQGTAQSEDQTAFSSTGFSDFSRARVLARAQTTTAGYLVRRAEVLTQDYLGFGGPNAEEINQEAADTMQLGAEYSAATDSSDIAKERVRTRSLAGQARVFGATAAGREKADRITRAAAGAVGRYLEDHSGTGIMGIGGDDRPTKAGQRQAMRRAMLAAGASTTEVEQLMQDHNFEQQAVTVSAQSWSEDQQNASNRVAETGGELNGQGGDLSVGKLRERATHLRETALEGLGIGTGIFSGTTEAQQKAVLDVVTGSDGAAKTRRSTLAIRAMRERAKHLTGDEKTNLERRAQRMEQQLQRTTTLEQRQTASASLEGLEGDTLEDIGEKLGDTDSPEALQRVLDAAGKDAGDAQASGAAESIVRRFGREGATVLNRSGVQGLKQYLKAGRGSMSDAERRRTIEGIDSGDVTRDTIEQHARQQGQGRGSTTIAGGLLAQVGGLLGIDRIQQAVQGGEPGNAGAGATPTDFAGAVTTFSEASDKLLRAAEQAEGMSEGVSMLMRSLSGGIGGVLNIFG